jgi:catechol 2,3-dioxygenase-like lactoylglutathione lyase family enzyme
MPTIDGILETALHVDDLARSASFYRDVLGFRSLFESQRLIAFDTGHRGVLLLFPKGAAVADVHDANGTIPGHGGAGRLHVAFAIPAGELDAWRARLADRGVAITAEYRWSRGGTSLYFDDPDGHLLELATPGLWATY